MKLELYFLYKKKKSFDDRRLVFDKSTLRTSCTVSIHGKAQKLTFKAQQNFMSIWLHFFRKLESQFFEKSRNFICTEQMMSYDHGNLFVTDVYHYTSVK